MEAAKHLSLSTSRLGRTSVFFSRMIASVIAKMLCSHQVRGAQERIERTRIGPPAVENRKCHGSFGDVRVVHVRDFKLAAMRRLQLAALVEHGCVVEIN